MFLQSEEAQPLGEAACRGVSGDAHEHTADTVQWGSLNQNSTLINQFMVRFEYSFTHPHSLLHCVCVHQNGSVEPRVRGEDTLKTSSPQRKLCHHSSILSTASPGFFGQRFDWVHCAHRGLRTPTWLP